MMMNNLLVSAVFSSVATLVLFGAEAKAQNTPEGATRKLYNLVVKEKIGGLPDDRRMLLIKPYLSSGLRALFAKARKKQNAFVQANPDEKPPWADGCLFSCAFEGPRTFRPGRTRFTGRYAYVPLILAEGSVSWIDTILLLKEGGRWVVWDVRMGCDWPFRMGPTLRAMLKED